MSDVLFRYLLHARERDRSLIHRFFLADERSLAAAIDRVVETAAIRVELTTQHDDVSRHPIHAPASRAEQVMSTRELRRDPPTAGNPARRTDRWAIRSTLEVIDCAGCHATGIAKCDACMGVGRVACPYCSGVGMRSTAVGAATRCWQCEGTALKPCTQCRGRGSGTHSACAGEGKVASWQEEVHNYSVTCIPQTIAPSGAPRRVRTAIYRAFKEPGVDLATATAAEIIGALGYDTRELREVIDEALRVQPPVLVRHPRDEPGVLFRAIAVRVLPVSICVTRSELADERRQAWLIGRGEEAVEILPRPLFNPARTFTLLAVSSGAFLAGLGIGAWLDGSASVAAELAAGAVASFVAGSPGLRRNLLRRREAVRVVAVLSRTTLPTAFLPCLAAVGSQYGGLEPVDREWREDLRRLLGSGPSSTRSRSVGLKTPDGFMVRLVEVARSEHLTAQEWSRLVDACAGVLYLQPVEPGSEPPLQSRRPTSEFHLVVDTEATECDQAGMTPGHAVAVDVIRRAFIRETNPVLDWKAVFETLWGPVATLAMPAGRARRERRGTLAANVGRAVPISPARPGP